MIALHNEQGEIYHLRHPDGFAFAAIFNDVEQAVLAKIRYKLTDAKIITVYVK